MFGFRKKLKEHSLLSKRFLLAAEERERILLEMFCYMDEFRKRGHPIDIANLALLRHWPYPYDCRAVVRIWAIYDAEIKPIQLAIEMALKDGMHLMGLHEYEGGLLEVFHSDDGQFDKDKREALKDCEQGWYSCIHPPRDLLRVRNVRGPFASPADAWTNATGREPPNCYAQGLPQ